MSVIAQTAVRGEKPWVLKKLQPLPSVAARLMTLVSTDDVVFRRVADMIRVDPAFSAEVLKLSNSSLLGCRQTVHSILHAVAILGLERLKSLVMMVTLRNFLSSALQLPSALRCWRHSLACAFLAEDIAAACWLDKDQCYTAGLMHDIGRLALLANYPEDYMRMLEVADVSGCDVLECERNMFEIDHCEVGRWLMMDWKFPPLFLEITGRHHAEPAADRFDVATVIYLSCRLANMLGFQVAGPAEPMNLDEIRARLPEARRGKLKAEEELLLSVAGKINALECGLA